MPQKSSLPYRLNTITRVLEVAGQAVPLGSRAFDVLACLDENQDRVVSKRELLEKVWGGLSVEEGNLTVQISALRKILGSHTISTVPGVGYKLTVESDPDTRPSGPPLPDKPSLAVLPFTNLTGQDANDYLVDGIVSDLVSTLSRLPGIFVIASSSSFKYKGQAITLSDVGIELGVRYILEGSIQLGGDRFRITTQLVEAQSGHTIWTERFDGSVKDVFDLQDRVAERTASALEIELTLVEADRARAKPTESIQAYDLCLQAAPQVFRVANRKDFEAAMSLLDRALDLDPDYVTAKWLKIRAYMMASAARAIAYEEGRAGLTLARSLLQSRPNDPMALSHAGHILAYLGSELDLGYSAIRQADTLNPNSVFVIASAGWVAAYLGKYDDAIAYFERGYRLNPLHPNTAHCRSGHGYALIGLCRYEEAATALQDSLAEDPDFGSSVQALIVAYELSGKHDEAVSLTDRYLEKNPNATVRVYDENTPFSDPEMKSRFAQALGAAGLPD